MPITWTQGLLIGTQNGVNTNFSLPFVPDSQATRIIFNGRFLYRVANNPVPTQYAISGNNIILGSAPESSDIVWYMAGEAVALVSSGIAQIRPDFYYTVELRNTAGELVEILQPDIFAVLWTYNTVGGCGECEIALRRSFDRYGDIDLDYDVQIWRDLNPLGLLGTPLPAVLPITLGTTLAGARELRWSGFVRELESVFDEKESVRLRCSGYSRQLEYLAVRDTDTGDAKIYNDMDVGAIARDILDNYVISPNSKIQRTDVLGLVQDIGITATSPQFKTSAAEALRSLAELGANCEWGVRADREAYFLPRTQVVKRTHIIGSNIQLYSNVLNTDDIVHRVYLTGAGGLNATLNIATAPTGYAKERIVFAPWIADANDAVLWGTAYAARFGTAQRRGRLVKAATDEWIEREHPMGLDRVYGQQVFIKAGEPLPDQLPMLLGDVLGAVFDHRFRPHSISYYPTGDTLKVEINLGERGSAFADFLRMIEIKLDHLRQGI